MDKFDKIFQDHREAFEEEPAAGHFQRFETKLDQFHSGQKPKGNRWPFLKIASVLIIFLLSANLFLYLMPSKPGKAAKGFANKEMNETARFYNVRINSGILQLKSMADKGIGSNQELMQVEKELAEMDQLYSDLQKEYSENPADERVVNAMIAYYQTKLDIIEKIKSDLQNVQPIKNNKNENKEL
jgi:hypothetical protein